MMDTEERFEKNDFFIEAETALNLKIPATLKNLLIINGFENETVIADINDSDIKEITSFARNELHNVIDKEDLPKYYGPYWKNLSLFQLVPGHKNIITLLSKYYKKKLSKKSVLEDMCEMKKKVVEGTRKRRQALIIFYGPIELIGNGPFVLKQSDLLIINKKYKSMKSKLQNL